MRKRCIPLIARLLPPPHFIDNQLITAFLDVSVLKARTLVILKVETLKLHRLNDHCAGINVETKSRNAETKTINAETKSRTVETKSRNAKPKVEALKQKVETPKQNVERLKQKV